MEWVTILILVVVVFAIVAIGFILVPWLKNKEIIKEESINTTKQMLELIGLVLKSIQTDNSKSKDEIELVFGICEKVVYYVEQTMKNDGNDIKKDYAVKASKEILEKMNIEVTDDMEKMIEIAIESAVNLLPKTYA